MQANTCELNLLDSEIHIADGCLNNFENVVKR